MARSCCCPDLVPSLGIDYGKQVNLFSSQFRGPKWVTWRPDVEIVTHYPEILDCRELHVMTGRTSDFWGWGWGRRVSEFQPPTHLLSSTHLPACLVSVPTVGRILYRAQLEPCLNGGRWFPFPSVSPRADRRHPIPPSLRSFSFYPPTDFWTFFNSQILSSSSSIFLHHSCFSLGFITLGQ